ncbi:hypothetical protein [Gordonia aichiensis]
MAVTGQTVAAFLGQGDDTTLVALAGQHVTIVTAMARAYTRDNGFTGNEPADDIAAVITTATARLLARGGCGRSGGWSGRCTVGACWVRSWVTLLPPRGVRPTPGNSRRAQPASDKGRRGDRTGCRAWAARGNAHR